MIYQVDEIVITGNETTQESVILNLLKFSPGEKISAKNIADAKRNIVKSKLFRKVDIHQETTNGINAIKVNLTEKWYFYPIPLYLVQDDSYEDLSLGVNIIDENFLGMNHEVQLGGMLGYQKSINLFYNAKNVFGSSWNIYSMFQYKKSPVESGIDTIKNQSESYLSIIGISRVFFEDHTIGLSQGLNKETDSERENFQYSSLGINYTFDGLDDPVFPTQGWLLNSGINQQGLGLTTNIDYFNSFFSIKRPIALFPETFNNPLVLSLIFSQQDLFGHLIPNYKKFKIDYGSQKHFSELNYRGEHLLQQVIALKYKIWESPYFSLHWLDSFKNKKVKTFLKDLQVSFFGEIYNDNQLITKKVYDANFRDMTSIVGIALYSKLPIINNIIKFDAGWNVRDRFKMDNLNYKILMVSGL